MLFLIKMIDAVVRHSQVSRRILLRLNGGNEHRIAVEQLSIAAEGACEGRTFTVLHISDMHFGPGDEISWILAEIGRANADVIAITGDFIDDDEGIPAAISFARQLPLDVPRFAVLGNHDHYGKSLRAVRNDTERLVRELRSAGITVLVNESARLTSHGMWIVGVDDHVTGAADIAQAVKAVPHGARYVLLTHTPDLLLSDLPWPPMLTLAGHTHGGQIVLPVIGPLLKVSRLPGNQQKGLHTVNGYRVYTSAGLGYSGPRLRIRCPPSMALLRIPSDM